MIGHFSMCEDCVLCKETYYFPLQSWLSFQWQCHLLHRFIHTQHLKSSVTRQWCLEQYYDIFQFLVKTVWRQIRQIEMWGEAAPDWCGHTISCQWPCAAFCMTCKCNSKMMKMLYTRQLHESRCDEMNAQMWLHQLTMIVWLDIVGTESSMLTTIQSCHALTWWDDSLGWSKSPALCPQFWVVFS